MLLHKLLFNILFIFTSLIEKINCYYEDLQRITTCYYSMLYAEYLNTHSNWIPSHSEFRVAAICTLTQLLRCEKLFWKITVMCKDVSSLPPVCAGMESRNSSLIKVSLSQYYPFFRHIYMCVYIYSYIYTHIWNNIHPTVYMGNWIYSKIGDGKTQKYIHKVWDSQSEKL